MKTLMLMQLVAADASDFESLKCRSAGDAFPGYGKCVDVKSLISAKYCKDDLGEPKPCSLMYKYQCANGKSYGWLYSEYEDTPLSENHWYPVDYPPCRDCNHETPIEYKGNVSRTFTLEDFGIVQKRRPFAFNVNELRMARCFGMRNPACSLNCEKKEDGYVLNLLIDGVRGNPGCTKKSPFYYKTDLELVPGGYMTKDDKKWLKSSHFDKVKNYEFTFKKKVKYGEYTRKVQCSGKPCTAICLWIQGDHKYGLFTEKPVDMQRCTKHTPIYYKKVNKPKPDHILVDVQSLLLTENETETVYCGKNEYNKKCYVKCQKHGNKLVTLIRKAKKFRVQCTTGIPMYKKRRNGRITRMVPVNNVQIEAEPFFMKKHKKDTEDVDCLQQGRKSMRGQVPEKIHKICTVKCLKFENEYFFLLKEVKDRPEEEDWDFTI